MNIKPEYYSNTKLLRNNEVLSSDVDSETILLHMESNSYYGLNDISSRIWALLSTSITFRQLIHILVKEYDITNENCARDTKHFLNKLASHNLLIIDNEET